MVSALAAPPDWEVVHFNPRIFRLNPTDESGTGGEAAAKLQEKGHMSFMEFHILVPQVSLCMSVAPLLPFRDLAWMCYFVSA